MAEYANGSKSPKKKSICELFYYRMEKLFTTLFLTGISRRRFKLKIKYFSDTDTALLEFTDNPVKETREISENVYLDLDADGNLVSMTIEHARTTAQLPDIAYQQIDKEPA